MPSTSSHRIQGQEVLKDTYPFKVSKLLIVNWISDPLLIIFPDNGTSPCQLGMFQDVVLLCGERGKCFSARTMIFSSTLASSRYGGVTLRQQISFRKTKVSSHLESYFPLILTYCFSICIQPCALASLLGSEYEDRRLEVCPWHDDCMICSLMSAWRHLNSSTELLQNDLSSSGEQPQTKVTSPCFC